MSPESRTRQETSRQTLPVLVQYTHHRERRPLSCSLLPVPSLGITFCRFKGPLLDCSPWTCFLYNLYGITQCVFYHIGKWWLFLTTRTLTFLCTVSSFGA